MAADATNLDVEKIEATVKHVFGMLGGAVVSGMIYLGDRLGLYWALAGADPVTSDELAARTGLHERWVREWLRGQAAAGLIDYDGQHEGGAPRPSASRAIPRCSCSPPAC